MNWSRPEYDDRLSPRMNKILDIISYAIVLLLILGPIFYVLVRQNGN